MRRSVPKIIILQSYLGSIPAFSRFAQHRQTAEPLAMLGFFGGADADRTRDLLNTIPMTLHCTRCTMVPDFPLISPTKRWPTVQRHQIAKTSWSTFSLLSVSHAGLVCAGRAPRFGLRTIQERSCTWAGRGAHSRRRLGAQCAVHRERRLRAV